MVNVSSLVASMALLLLALLALVADSAPLRNVVVMISDDMSPFYLDPTHPVKMPTVKKLASRGTEFTNAYSALASCGPSRMAFLTGRYPTTTNLMNFERYVPQVSGLKTVAQYLADEHGYETVSFGKVFHKDWDPKDPETQGQFEAGLWTNRQRGGGSSDVECRSAWFCKHRSLTRSGDYRLARDFIKFAKNRNSSRPLLAFVGFRKPHLEVGVPATFANKRFPGVDHIASSRPASVGVNNSIVPFEQSLQYGICYWEILLRRVNGRRAHPVSKFLLPSNRRTLNTMRHFYFAAINYVDWNIGYVISQIDALPAYANNTAFVFISDHGFANGENSMFCKTSLFEQAAKTPFVVAPARNMEGVDRGRVRTDPINLVDLFPTVVHLATDVVLPREATVDTSGMQLDGWSVLQKDRPVLSPYTFAVISRCNLKVDLQNWQCGIGIGPCARIPIKYIGLMVRTKTHKFVEFRYFNDVITHCGRPNWPGLLPTTRARMKTVNQIDQAATKVDFSRPPVQYVLYDDMPSEPNAKWGDWEKSNVLLDKMNDTSVIADAMEFSATIRWKFDPDFAGAVEPCSGNGIVRLKNRSQWTSLGVNVGRGDVQCECLPGFSGETCEVPR